MPGSEADHRVHPGSDLQVSSSTPPPIWPVNSSRENLYQDRHLIHAGRGAPNDLVVTAPRPLHSKRTCSICRRTRYHAATISISSVQARDTSSSHVRASTGLAPG